MRWIILVAIIVLGLTAVYILQTPPMRRHELFADYITGGAMKGPDGLVPLFADVAQGLPLSDVLKTATGLTKMNAKTCAATDTARQQELGGQYVQRTNNYRRDYPDDCSSLMSDFVGGFYAGTIGATVPCNGSC